METKVKLTDDKKILEFCGFKWVEFPHAHEQGYWRKPLEEPVGTHAATDIGFLFKYAVPKLYHCELIKSGRPDNQGCWHVYIHLREGIGGAAFKEDKDPAEAFKQALIKVIDKEE